MGTLREDKYRFLIIYLSVLLRMKNVLDKCSVNNNAENIKTPTTLISLKYTQNWLKEQHKSNPRSIAHSNICRRLFRGKIHFDWFHGLQSVQGSWQHGEEVGYWYPSRIENTICKWEIYVPLVTKGSTVRVNIVFFLLNTTSAIAILDLISRINLAQSFIVLANFFKNSTLYILQLFWHIYVRAFYFTPFLTIDR